MTSDTAQTETKLQAKRPETFRSHLPAIIAAATGTVLAAFLGSLIGTAGTIVGMVVGSMASGTCSWWAERGIRRSTELAAARAEVLRAKGYHLHTGETATRADATRTAEATRADSTRADATRTSATWNTATRTSAAFGAGADIDATATQAIPSQASSSQASSSQASPGQASPGQAIPGRSGAHGRARPRRRWVLPATFIAIAFVACAIVVTLIEGAAGQAALRRGPEQGRARHHLRRRLCRHVGHGEPVAHAVGQRHGRHHRPGHRHGVARDQFPVVHRAVRLRRHQQPDPDHEPICLRYPLGHANRHPDGPLVLSHCVPARAEEDACDAARSGGPSSASDGQSCCYLRKSHPGSG